MGGVPGEDGPTAVPCTWGLRIARKFLMDPTSAGLSVLSQISFFTRRSPSISTPFGALISMVPFFLKMIYCLSSRYTAVSPSSTAGRSLPSLATPTMTLPNSRKRMRDPLGGMDIKPYCCISWRSSTSRPLAFADTLRSLPAISLQLEIMLVKNFRVQDACAFRSAGQA